jgi:hypothetical protein
VVHEMLVDGIQRPDEKGGANDFYYDRRVIHGFNPLPLFIRRGGVEVDLYDAQTT